MITFLSDDVLSNSIAVKAYYAKTAESRAASLMLRLYADLIDSGFAIGVAIPNNSHIIWLEQNNAPIGGICYSIQPELSQAWIIFSFTMPAYRGLGVNQVCHKYLEADMKKRGLAFIGSHVHIDNISRLKSCDKVGLKPNFYRMHKAI